MSGGQRGCVRAVWWGVVRSAAVRLRRGMHDAEGHARGGGGDVGGVEEEEMDGSVGTFEELGTLDSGKLEPAHAALDERFDIGVLKCLLAELS